VLKGRLLKLFWIKVDGQEVYRDAGDESEERDDADAGNDQAPERVNGQVPSTDGRDQHDTNGVDEPDSGRNTPEPRKVSALPERTGPRTNRYPPLRRHGNANTRRTDIIGTSQRCQQRPGRASKIVG